MKYTDKEYYIDSNYISKLDLMIKRMTGNGTDDNILIIDGDEGQGKTEFAVGTCYYVAHQTGREYNTNNNIFFKLDEILEFASKTKDQIIHFDEGALGLLTTQWWNENNRKFLQLVMTARKKRHFIVICIPKFYKLNTYLIEERSIGLVHIYSRNNLQKGSFCYYTKERKERLYQDWKRKRIKTYKKHYSFRGTFVLAMKKVFTIEQQQQYEDKKDEAILSITQTKDKEKVNRFQVQRDKLIYLIKDKLKISSPKLSDMFESYGIELKTTQINDISRAVKQTRTTADDITYKSLPTGSDNKLDGDKKNDNPINIGQEEEL